MEQTLSKVNSPTISISRAVILLAASMAMMLISIYAFSFSIENYTEYNLSPTEKDIVSVFACIALPLAWFIVSQLLIKFRGLYWGVWSIFCGSAITLVAQVPTVFAILG